MAQTADADVDSAVVEAEVLAEASLEDFDTSVFDEDGPFAPWGLPTPPGAEDYEVNQVAEEDLNPQGLDEWHPTQDPKDHLVPGQMRSDREEIPAGYSKEEADQAEIREAQLANPNGAAFRARPGCGVYWPPHLEVCGLIKEKYDSIGGPTSFLLLPKTNELTNPDGVGKRTEFINGYIYWHPRTGAHTVSIPADSVWIRHGREQGFLGYPLSDDIAQGDEWYRQDFEGGHIYTHNVPVLPTQASIQGAIFDKWQSIGAQSSRLGYPISDELVTPDGRGRYNVFEHGMMYWTPETGAHAVYGPMLLLWGAKGFERSQWGYPSGDPVLSPDAPVVIKQNFERGELDLYHEIEAAGTVIVDGKPISALLVLFFGKDSLGTSSSHVIPGGTTLRASECVLPDSTQPQYGGVTIPAEYDYWACNEGYRSRVNFGRHDFCTRSPDSFVIWRPINTVVPALPGLVELKGPCSRHDMCMDEADAVGTGYGPCNAKFWGLIAKVCANVFLLQPGNNLECLGRSEAYFLAVTYVHRNHL
ncbi:LGFP repeat-containing protein [Corynebacterium lizhenjunii]|uniref:LGFP repeat-containing protein n=1 Tax=Corynebacterium lizhenjunii TaxID=2709394 RepID=UPI001FD62E1E|nr:hypothetical protein [Corynebacterium lizhenjunii]